MSDEPITLDTIVMRSPELVFNDIDGELVLLGIETGDYYGFNRMLSFIWNLMEEPIPVSTVADRIMESFAAEREVVESDLAEIFNRMLSDKLIEIG